MKKALIIFSGFNPRAVVSFLRTAEKAAANFAVIASSPDDGIYRTKYKQNVLAAREVPALNLDDIIEKIKVIQNGLDMEKYVIAPSTEAMNRFLLENRATFEKINCEIPLVALKEYEAISDKQAFGNLCRKNNVLVPREYEDPQGINLPFVAKPKKYAAGNAEIHSPILIFSEDERNTFAKNYDRKDFYYQEFIGGESYYLMYYFYKNGEVAKFSQINYVQQSEGKSIICAESSDFHESGESLKYEELFKSLAFTGLVMVEVKRQDNTNYMIEANPRFWGPSQLFIDAGVNLFEAFLYDHGLVHEKPQFAYSGKKTKYFWFGGLWDALASNGNIAYHAYDADRLAKYLPDWMASDIYNREDTREVFKSETGLRS